MKIIPKLKVSSSATIKIASFDVGIKNLAFCIMQYDHLRQPGSQFVIHNWQNVNLIPDNAPKYCVSLLKSGLKRGQPCGKKALYLSNDGQPLCKMHSSDDNETIRYQNVSNMTTLEIEEQAVRKLDEYPGLLDCDTIIIENQPTRGNIMVTQKIRHVSSILYSYFVIRGIVDGNKVRRVLYVSPHNKLSIYDGPDIKCNLTTRYSRNKFFGKRYCEYFLRGDPASLSLLSGHKKQDDLADCFLQGAWFLLSKEKKLPQKTNMTESRHQTGMRYREGKAVRPTSRTIQTGRYKLGHLKWIVQRHWLSTREKLLEFIKEEPKFGKSLEFYFGCLDEFLEHSMSSRNT